MTTRMEVYKCGMCGNMVEVVHGADGVMVCCGVEMVKLTENTVDASKEKHIPVVERLPNGVKVTVGSVLHPMEEKHFIEWIELIVGDEILRQYLKPGQPPVAFFEGVKGATVVAREYCNLHGLWKG
ncbi:MAG: desulfoferrodoxin [bacterium]